MSHKFNPNNAANLEQPDREQLLPPVKILSDAGLKSGMHFADIGCGGGFFTIPASSIVGSTGIIQAIDISGEMLSRLRAKNPPENIIISKSLEDQFPISDETVDLALMACVLHEADAPLDFLNEACRILKNKGRLIVIDFDKKPQNFGPPEEHRISRDEAKTLLSEAGFDVQNIVTLNEAHYRIIAIK